MMALTATCSEKIKGDILKSLQFSENDTDIIFKCPDRPNVFIDLWKRDNSDFLLSLFWLIDHLRKNGVQSKTAIIYCRSIDKVSEFLLLDNVLVNVPMSMK